MIVGWSKRAVVVFCQCDEQCANVLLNKLTLLHFTLQD